MEDKKIREISDVIDDMYEDNAHICETRWDGYIAIANSEKIVEELLKHYQIVSKDSVVISRGEYEELIDLQRTHVKDLTNAIQSFEESKADLKLEYKNHIKNLEKIIDRQSRDLNSQADRLIDLKTQLENKEKQTAEKILRVVSKRAKFADQSVFRKLCKDYGVRIKE